MNYDYQHYVYTYHPRFWDFWIRHANADFKSCEMYELNRPREARQLWKIHEDYRARYNAAIHVAIKRIEEFHTDQFDFDRAQINYPEIFKLFVKGVNLEYDAMVWHSKGRNKKARELQDRADSYFDQYKVALVLSREYD